jgi:hypothetical protein
MANIRHNTDCVTQENRVDFTSSLDTLAQLDNEPRKTTNASAYETLQKRAFSKYHTVKVLMPLIDLKNGREKQYWNTFHCCNTLEQNSEGKIISKYCKNRWCIVCNRIRSGILHHTHRKSLETVPTRFITLTSNLTKKCLTMSDLDATLDIYYKAWTKVWRNTKNKYGKLKCLRKTEATFSFHNGWFHPHFHIILENNSDEADFVISQWKRIISEHDGFASKKGNKNLPMDEGAYAEIFKYLCKMYDVTENKKTGKIDFVLPYPAQKLDDIFSALKGRRIFQTYNLSDVEIEDFEVENATIFMDEKRDYHTVWNWEQELKTWLDYSTGELRTEWKDFTKKEFNSE